MFMRGIGRSDLAAWSTLQPCIFSWLIYSCNDYKSHLIVIIFATLQPMLLSTYSAVGNLADQVASSELVAGLSRQSYISTQGRKNRFIGSRDVIDLCWSTGKGSMRPLMGLPVQVRNTLAMSSNKANFRLLFGA